MRVIIETIPHNEQRYETVGDWYIDSETKDWHIKISDTGDDMANKLVAIHEFVEMVLTQHKGITEESVTAFDEKYEDEREQGLHGETDEPGFDPQSPYMIEHTIATSVEMQVCAAAGISWKEYEDKIYAL